MGLAAKCDIDTCSKYTELENAFNILISRADGKKPLASIVCKKCLSDGEALQKLAQTALNNWEAPISPMYEDGPKHKEEEDTPPDIPPA